MYLYLKKATLHSIYIQNMVAKTDFVRHNNKLKYKNYENTDNSRIS